VNLFIRFVKQGNRRLINIANHACQEAEIAITGPIIAVTMVLAVAIYGARIANVKEWDSSRDGESE